MRNILLFVLLVACGSVPKFEKNLCISKCSQCPGADCQTLCSELDQKYQNPDCTEITQRLWECAAIQGCGFASECEDEINAFLSCE